MKVIKLFLYSITVGVLVEAIAFQAMVMAFDDKAHKALSEQATKISGLDNFLKTVLGFEFPGGVDESIVNGRSVDDLIQDGAFDEDRPLLWRPRHHFHNPRLAWDQAGWRPLPFSIQLGKSSILWSQDTNQIVGGKHSWKDARDSYFNALTATTDSDRKRYYGETFKTLGHLMHHVQDAAVPAHTRNDTHPSHAGIGWPDAFHGWAETQVTSISAMSPPPYNISALNQPSPDPQAPVPFSRLIDSTAGDIGLLALSPGLNLGIAEYSSANFFSDDTVNSSNFLSPVSSQVEVRAPEPDGTGRLRPYVYFKPGVGDTSYPLALASAMHSYVIDPLATPTEKGLDNKVFAGYGGKLFPPAISYSAGLIDYFFRGRLEWAGYDQVRPPTPTSPTPPTPTAIPLWWVYNATPAEDTGAGILQLVLRYKGKFNTSESFPDIVVSPQIVRTVPNYPGSVAVSFNFNSLPFPTTIDTRPSCQVPVVDFSLCQSWSLYSGILVYRGPLGTSEVDSVVVSICPQIGFGRLVFNALITPHSDYFEIGACTAPDS